jgi:hypothetical protein
MAQERLILTEAQLAALEKAKTEKEAHGDFESEHPGYLRCPGHLVIRTSPACNDRLRICRAFNTLLARGDTG